MKIHALKFCCIQNMTATSLLVDILRHKKLFKTIFPDIPLDIPTQGIAEELLLFSHFLREP